MLARSFCFFKMRMCCKKRHPSFSDGYQNSQRETAAKMIAQTSAMFFHHKNIKHKNREATFFKHKIGKPAWARARPGLKPTLANFRGVRPTHGLWPMCPGPMVPGPWALGHRFFHFMLLSSQGLSFRCLSKADFVYSVSAQFIYVQSLPQI